jgi:hypothetical protein
MTGKKFKDVGHNEEWVLYGTSFGFLFGFLAYIFSSNEGSMIIGLLIGFSMGLLFTKLYPDSDNNEKENN